MSLPPYKHTRNPCLQTEDEPMIPGLAGAPLITHRCVQEKRRTSDQRVARLQNMPGVDFEYEYVPTIDTDPLASLAGFTPRRRTILKSEIEDLHYQHHTESKPANFKSLNGKGFLGAAGDPIGIVNQDINEGTTRNDIRSNGTEKPGDYNTELKDAGDDAKSTCSIRSSVSRRSLVSRCSRSSYKTDDAYSKKSQKSQKRCESKDSLSGTHNAVLQETADSEENPKQAKTQESNFQKFGRIANGLDDDDLRHRRR